MTVAVTSTLWGLLVANSRVTHRTVNDTHFIVGEVERLGKSQPSRNCHCCPSSLRSRLKRPGTPSAQNTMHVSPMEAASRNSNSRQRRSVSEC